VKGFAQTSSFVRKAYPIEIRDTARRLRAEGFPCCEVGSQLGVPACTVSRWTRGMAVQTRVLRHNKQRLANANARARARVIRAEGRTYQMIADLIGVARTTAFRWTCDIAIVTGHDMRWKRQRSDEEAGVGAADLTALKS